MIDIESLTLKEIREIAKLACCASSDPGPWEVGKIYLIRTVTMIDVGRLVAVYPTELVLEEACWVADTGRFSSAVASAEFGETEPFPDGRVIIGRGSIIDSVQITKTIRIQK